MSKVHRSKLAKILDRIWLGIGSLIIGWLLLLRLTHQFYPSIILAVIIMLLLQLAASIYNKKRSKMQLKQAQLDKKKRLLEYALLIAPEDVALEACKHWHAKQAESYRLLRRHSSRPLDGQDAYELWSKLNADNSKNTIVFTIGQQGKTFKDFFTSTTHVKITTVNALEMDEPNSSALIEKCNLAEPKQEAPEVRRALWDIILIRNNAKRYAIYGALMVLTYILTGMLSYLVPGLICIGLCLACLKKRNTTAC